MGGEGMSRGLRRTELGATMLEYGLLVTLIAAIVAGAVVALGPAVSDLFTGAASSL